MKHITTVIAAILLASVPLRSNADDTKRYWLTGHSNPDMLRFGDMSRATKIDTKGGFARIFAERDGKLAIVWEAKSQEAADTAKKIAGDNPTEWSPIENEQFVNLKKVVSVDINKDQAGKETAILHGQTGKLGTVSDASAVANIKKLVEKK
jgi:hypothetical protein